MADKQLIYIDRRKSGRGKSAPNRQRVIRRIKEFIKNSTPTTVGSSGVNTSNSQTNPVHVAGAALEEPFFAYDSRSGDTIWVVNSNPKYDRGDEIPIDRDDGSGSGGPGGGTGPNGEDDFIVNVAADEFMDLFFEDCELPNLSHEKVTEKLDNKKSHAGFAPQGNQSQMSVIRTYKQNIGRRNALASPYKREIEELEEERAVLLEKLGNQLNAVANARLKEIDDRIEELKRKIAAVSGFDKVDLRFHKHEHKPLRTVEAVLFMVMDISGSMEESMKRVAKRWFALLYSFIKRRYPSCELVFVAHTTEAFEMSQDDFFSTRMNGGTMVSPALEMVNKIINDRYDSEQTNIYVSHASDGDNWYTDHAGVLDEMKRLMSKIQHFSYVEIPNPNSYAWNDETDLWNAYEEVEVSENKMSMSVIESADDVYEIFKKIFKKK